MIRLGSGVIPGFSIKGFSIKTCCRFLLSICMYVCIAHTCVWQRFPTKSESQNKAIMHGVPNVCVCVCVCVCVL